MNAKVILAVEDEFLILEFLADVLADVGFDVLTASNADEAILLLEHRTDICLLITDIDMPGSMDGMHLAAIVRNRWPPVRIVITTGKGLPRTLPPDARFIPKPYASNDMVELVVSLC